AGGGEVEGGRRGAGPGAGGGGGGPPAPPSPPPPASSSGPLGYRRTSTSSCAAWSGPSTSCNKTVTSPWQRSRRAPDSRIKASSATTSSASSASRRDSSECPQESPNRPQVAPRTRPASPLPFSQDRGASRLSVAGGSGRSKRPAPNRVQRCRPEPWLAGNASF